MKLYKDGEQQSRPSGSKLKLPCRKVNLLKYKKEKKSKAVFEKKVNISKCKGCKDLSSMFIICSIIGVDEVLKTLLPLVGRMFAKGPGSIPGRIIPNTLKYL